MLPYALAIAVGLSSSILFLTAFFFKDIHRQDDFFWSGVGLFYALVLWFCSTSITGAILLGQLAVVALLSAYFWQLLKLRKAIANPETKESLDSFSVVGFFQNLIKRSPAVKTPEVKPEAKPETKIAVTNQPSNKTQEDAKNSASKEVVRIDNQPVTKQEKQISSFPEKTPSLTNTKLNEVLDAAESTTTTNQNQAETLSNSAATTPPAEKKVSEPKITKVEETSPSTPEVIRVETTEIKVEKITIVEEESNWDDEEDSVEDIPSSSIKVIQEVSSTEDVKKDEE
jgi:Ycf66 protein N-terminus